MAPKNSESYAFYMGRNWAVTGQRDAGIALRRVRWEAAEAKASALLAEETGQVREELFALLGVLAAEFQATVPSKLRWLGAVRLAYLDGVKPAQWNAMYPGVSRDVLYQWKRRGVKAVTARASPFLVRWLREHRTAQWGGAAQ